MTTRVPAVASRVHPDVPASLQDIFKTHLQAILRSASPVQLHILNHRLFCNSPATLREIGTEFKLSGERIRQLERKLSDSLTPIHNDLRTLAVEICASVGPIVEQTLLDQCILEILDIQRPYSDVDELALKIIRNEMDYTCKQGICFSMEAREIADTITNAIRCDCDDVGIISASDILSHLPDSNWHQYLSEFIRWCNIYRFSGSLALRNTYKARAKAALLHIGRPATNCEISQIAGIEIGRVSAHLSSIESVARAAKARWGLLEWIDDVYEGIPAEILQRIVQDGGSTRISRLLDELPRLFGVSESSIRAYLATPAFHVEHGRVTEAQQIRPSIGDLDTAIEGYDDSGDPYWCFEIHERYLSGYSIIGVPGEIALALGCNIGQRVTASVRNPANCTSISVNWRTTAISGPEIGRVADIIRAIGAEIGQIARMVIHADHTVSFAIHRENDHASSNLKIPG